MRRLSVAALVTATISTTACLAGSTSEAAHMPELKFDFRSGVHEEILTELGDDADTPGSTLHGMPGWLLSMPDSLRATATGRTKGVAVRVYVGEDTHPIGVRVTEDNRILKRASISVRPHAVTSWIWDLKDSSRVRVGPGIYRIVVETPVHIANGYVVVEGSR